jgi:Mg-chelatase subunit ChlD
MMDLRREIRERLVSRGREAVEGELFKGIRVAESARRGVLASLLAGHHLLLVGPPGVGKTTVAARIPSLLGDRWVVSGCPVRCSPQRPECPWCRQRLDRGEALGAERIQGSQRMQRVCGSSDLKSSDLLGDFDPQMALAHGILDPRAFVPGKLLRANGGVLLVDFIDRISERVLNTVLMGAAGDGLSLGSREERFPLDILIVATAASDGLSSMPADLSDHFDLVDLEVPQDRSFVSGLLGLHAGRPAWKDLGLEVVERLRCHEDLSRSLSPRGVIRYGELLDSFGAVAKDASADVALPVVSRAGLPHRLRLAPHAASSRSARDIVEEVCSSVLGRAPAEERWIPMSRERILGIVEEIARVDHFRKPLKFGLFDLLLKRIRRFPDSHLADLHREMVEFLARRRGDRQMADNLTFDLLSEVDRAREKQERISAEIRAKLEAEALVETVRMLEDKQILCKRERGYGLSRKGIAVLLERLAPRVWEGARPSGHGLHRAGRKYRVGEGRVVGSRAWRYGDAYRDFSLKATLRHAIRHRHQQIRREDLQAVVRDVRMRMDVVLCLDLSGTMEQLEKLWYAKESAIALALASSGTGDRMGLVTFSNLARVVSDLTGNTYQLTERILDLDLHENAFTNVGYGLLTARGLFARHSREHGKQHIILVSDGDATAPHPSPSRFAIQEAARAARKGISISCVCINEENADPDLLAKIARIGRGRLVLVEDTKGMREALLAEREAARG